MKHLAILGSTGSIGTQTLDVVRMHPDLFKVETLACGKSIDLLEKQAREFHPSMVAVYDSGQADLLRGRLSDTDIRVASGMDGIIGICTADAVDLVVTAIVGMIGIQPTVAAMEAGKDIALANKETCVCAGHIIMPLAGKTGVHILPVDSEHSAIFQSLQGRADSKIKKILLTASGGPFRGMTREQLEHVTVKEALAHPTWSMGPKVTIDSASMVNKGLEVIEARWLFDVSPDQIQVVIQPQSIIHSAVEYEDNSVIAQMAVSDMRVPIQYALTYPEHLPSPAGELDFTAFSGIEIGVPDNETFKGLPLARKAIAIGGSMPCVFNAANEWANACFRQGRIHFLQIYDIIEEVMERHTAVKDPSVEEILAIRKEIDAFCAEKYLS